MQITTENLKLKLELEKLNLKYKGYKFYKINDDNTIDLVRCISIVPSANSFNFIVKILDDKNSNGTKSISLNDIEKYTPLKPYGLFSISIIGINTDKEIQKDVMVMIYQLDKMKILGDYEPFAICRQSITDFFNYLLCKDPMKNDLVGVCVTKYNCPANVNYTELASCDNVYKNDVISIYRDDTIDSILDCIPIKPYDAVLKELYKSYLDYSHKIIPMNKEKRSKIDTNGWCSSVKELLTENNFMADFNEMCNITGFEFDMNEILEPTDNIITKKLSKEGLIFFNITFKVNVVDSKVIQYDYNIDLTKFNNENWIIIRDINNKLWLVVYLCEGEFLEQELLEEANKLDISSRLRLSYYDKYHNMKKSKN